MPKIVSFILATLGIVFVIISGILLSMFPTLLQSMVKKQLVLREGSDVFEKWSAVNIPIYTKFYFFDVQNPDEVEINGSEPIVVERGPYTFLQKIRKEIIGFENSKQLISYKDFKSYHFIREKSVGDLTDEITVVNIPVVAGVDGAIKESETNDLGEIVIDVISAIIRELGETLFEVRTVDQMLFTGYRVALLDRMAEVGKEFGLEVPENLPNNTFGLMVNKNDSDQGIMTVYTGSDNTEIFRMHSWEMSRSLSFWNGSTCNMINGTDSSGFGPGITRNSILYAFQADFCRSALLTFSSDSEVHGIKTLRFILPDSNFQAPWSSPSTACFCTQRQPRREGVCDVSGLLDVSTCSDGAPIALSPAHFLGGDKHLTEDVLGLRPSTAKHQMFLDIEPLTGSVLSAAKRLQINVVLRNDPRFEIVSNIKGITILPVLWIEETVEVTEEFAMEMKQTLFSKITLVKTVLKSFLVVGLVIIFLAIVIITIFHAKKTAPSPQPVVGAGGGHMKGGGGLTRLNNETNSSKLINPRIMRIVRKT